MSGAALLEVLDLHAYYGRAHILSDVSLAVPTGSVVALMGRNGAGKYTTLKAIMGLVPPSRGSALFGGVDVAGRPSHEIARLGLGYVPEERRIFSELSVLENLSVGRQRPRAGAPAWTPELLFEIFPNLAGMRHRLGGRMSGGEQQMLTIARTLMGNPLCVLLDEPSEGLAPVIVDQMAAMILRLKREGLTLLLSEQNLYFATEVCDYAFIIERGRICYAGAMQVLMRDDAVRNQYLSV
jgi:branched-chain amino acid transport system ATP-binding protein